MTCSLPSHENHICRYCGEHLDFIIVYSDYDVYNCKPCNAEFKYCEGIRHITILYTEINGSKYRALIHKFGLYISYEKPHTYKLPGQQDERSHLYFEVVKFFDIDEMPILTPSNVNRKVKAILLFS